MNEKNLTLLQEAFHIAFEVNQHVTHPRSQVILCLSRPEIKVLAPNSQWDFNGKYLPVPVYTAMVFRKNLSEEFKSQDSDIIYRLQQKLKITDPLWPAQQLVEYLTAILGVTPEPYVSKKDKSDIGFTWVRKQPST